ncbi:MAG TPA: hypothetical protein EYM74_07590 [Candidatus Marinimicrobia bacterium]|jgi:hypothetical protein|nr:hypothetical protein [Candidatus Neomarinimicrobiota bacterium]HIM26909.1 hypothetical protein [Candidatus Neomarinimicrobiota bacterium]HIN27154.1 hypothetical protein [Candidatus Neomarinimicrobiota bacterium]|tara:strand:- start:320 stop:1228 length:909 start_codon:yes stop_codon:yes gene_type:complete
MKLLNVINIILLIAVRINATAYEALNSWYHPHTLAMVGSGSSLHIAESDRLNPSLMFSNEQLLTIGHVQYPADISTQMAQIVLPRNYGTLGGTIRHVSYGVFEGFDKNGNPTANYAAGESWVTVSIAKQLFAGKLQWGASTGFLFSNIGEYSSTLVTGTAGVSLNLSKYNMHAGLAIRNLAVSIKNYSSAEIHFPAMLNFSLAKGLAYLPLKMVLDFDYGLYNRLMTFHLGGVFVLPYNTQLRFGTSSLRIDQRSQINLIRDFFTDTGLGITITTHQYIIDIGTYIYGTGGSVIAIGLGLKL